ncbi:trehalose-phosphatase [Emcibacter sp. SYSU 3D8]|uniref:trehalose-phosphatase n=1 Tax=Emcibacter sp. SYSU 3D8 TaxID=3133969 RepID=UPI0031FEC5DA
MHDPLTTRPGNRVSGEKSAVDGNPFRSTKPVALFLDVDGTLLEIRERPDLVTVPPALLDIISGVAQRLDGALALVSGRSIADIDHLLAPLRPPASGQHGSEMRLQHGGVVTPRSTEPIPFSLRRKIAEVAAAIPGVEVEDKGQTVAVHYRAAPQVPDTLKARIENLVANSGLELLLVHGRKVLEVRDARISKGTAVHDFMQTPPFAGRLPIFVGDDVTDEDGFAAVESFGGTALPVGRVHSARRDTAFETPADVRAWLGAFSQIPGAM